MTELAPGWDSIQRQADSTRSRSSERRRKAPCSAGRGGSEWSRTRGSGPWALGLALGRLRGSKKAEQSQSRHGPPRSPHLAPSWQSTRPTRTQKNRQESSQLSCLFRVCSKWPLGPPLGRSRVATTYGQLLKLTQEAAVPPVVSSPQAPNGEAGAGSPRKR